ncbi:MAG: MBL fold metallo-hydrolase [Candidatus Muiribacterium halophilum]|uniref:MBL fold metallo-hydrolase n=1 Tax=Muiribacterium halophilum TaxID=2053465 RepID=A0A2N5ZBZ5_MUIH1|nr:MAG: MBL fold metallo-hydrolase [Candidatus Muirbacterium halophilum]
MEKIALTHLVLGELDTNCYIISDLEKRNCIVIDPGAEGEKVLHELEIKDLKLEAIINTHGHMDHIGGNEFLLKETGCKLYIHEDDKDMLQDPAKNLSVYSGNDVISPPATDILEDKQILEFGNIRLKIIHTPGHSPGSVSILLDKRLFSGDTLFKK